MHIALRTDTAMAELALLDAKGRQVTTERWEAGRQLSSQLLDHIQLMLLGQQLTWQQLTGVIVFQGPGSFTGLRIGITVANAIAYAQAIPVVGAQGEGWMADGVKRLKDGENDTRVIPHYGAAANVTKPGKRLDAR
jgi:tRNA threonylcarbamoyladenosine biosynthesis protein TsaB